MWPETVSLQPEAKKMSMPTFRCGGCACSKQEVVDEERILGHTERERSPVKLGAKTVQAEVRTDGTIKGLA